MEQKNVENFKKQMAQNTMQAYVERLRNNDVIFDEVRYATGFPALDKALSGGFIAGLHCVGAISSIGKTTFVLQMAESMASGGMPVIFFSLEMRPEQLVAKSVSRNMYLSALEQLEKQKIDIYHHAKGYTDLMSEKNRKAFTKQELSLYEMSLKRSEMSTLGLQIVSDKTDGRPFCIDEIVEYINTYISVTKKKPVVIIDYLQFIRPGMSMVGGTDKQMMDHIISMLVFTAKTQRIPIITISSLNRGGYDSPVTMASFKESGFIEYSCETMLGLQLKGVGTKEFDLTKAKTKIPKDIELVIVKGRGIEVGSIIDYRFYGRHNYFEEVGCSNRSHKSKAVLTESERKRVR